MKLLGTRATMGISEVEEFIQGHLLEQFPVALAEVKSIAELSRHHKTVSQKLEWLVAKALQPFGIVVAGIQVLSLLPPKEVLQAMDEKLAMDLIGNKRDYLLYKAASSLDALHPSKGSDPMQMMMGLMIGKGLLGYDYHEKEQQHLSIAGPNRCPHCQSESQAQFRFCPQCGKEQKK